MYIVITQPFFFEGEAERITLMFQSGLRRLHLRKPGSAAVECRRLLDAIPSCYHRRIVLHDHFTLLGEYGLGGVHFNSRNPEPSGFQSVRGASVDALGCETSGIDDIPTTSVSCHSIDELRVRRGGPYTYLTLSPIFDSISKQGYRAAFTRDELLAARAEGIIDERVFALGGICRDNIGEALRFGFGGAMVLGDAWRQPRLPVVLSIAGSDPSAGAGVQQDLKTVTHCGCYGATVVTALTSQNTMGVSDVMPVPPQVVESQLKAVFDDLNVDAVKIGMIPNAEVARVIISVLRDERERRVLPVVCDPVMLSTSGSRLMAEDCIALVAGQLFPMCTLVTPNMPEKAYLDSHGLEVAASMLVKGGHAEGCDMTDSLYIIEEGRTVEFTMPRIDSRNLHGTGCTLSSAIAASMAQGNSLVAAVGFAKRHIQQAIAGGRDLGIGHGNGPLWYEP